MKLFRFKIFLILTVTGLFSLLLFPVTHGWAQGNISISNSQIKKLIRQLKSSSSETRKSAILNLAKMKAKEANSELIEILKIPKSDESEQELVYFALNQIGEGSNDDIHKLIEIIRAGSILKHGGWYSSLTLRTWGAKNTKETVPPLIELLMTNSQPVSIWANSALSGISEILQDQETKLSDSELEKTILWLKRSIQIISITQGDSTIMRRSLAALEREQDTRIFRRIGIAIQNNSLFPIFLTVIFLYLIILFVSPRWLLLLIPASFLMSTKYTQGFFRPFLWLIFQPRVLDAWVNKYLSFHTAKLTEKSGARTRFWSNATAHPHSTTKLHSTENIPITSFYIPLPLHIETSSHTQRYEDLPLNLLQEIFQKNTARLLIYGEGGIGKTSLACKLAESAMANTPSHRLHKKYSLLPVLIGPEQIEQELKLNKPIPMETTTKDGDNTFKTSDMVMSQPFVEAIRKQLQHLIDEQIPIHDELLKQLLQSGRILVIVDRFSEMSEDARRTISPASKIHPINALIVTSRKRETFDNFKMDVIEPLPLKGSELMRFMEEYYLRTTGFPLKQQHYKACENLQKIVEVRDNRAIVTVLFATLAADQLIAEKPLPASIPDLILNSLDLLNDQVLPQGYKPNRKTIHSDIQAIAWECLQSTLYPNTATLDNITKALGKLDSKIKPEQRLKYLIDELRVVEMVGSEKDQVRIVLDPMAEYLAGLYLIKIHGDNLRNWKDFLKRVDESEKAATQEFILAVYDCCRVAGFDSVVNLFKQYFDQNLKDEFDS